MQGVLENISQLNRCLPFKFTADMAQAWRKVKREHDLSFTPRYAKFIMEIQTMPYDHYSPFINGINF